MVQRARVLAALMRHGAIGLVLGAGFAQAAWAQEAPQDDDMMGEIIVTAQKREERLKDVPSTIAVLNSSALQAQGADKVEDYVARVPGLTMSAGGLGQQQLTIRGVTTGTGFASTVATYIDDAPVGSSNGDGTGGLITPEIDSIDLARIEVLKGPQGTLYGASNIGGLLHYVTVTPNPNELQVAGSVEGRHVEGGEWGYAVRGRLNLPVVTDKIGVSVSGYARKDPGFVDNVFTGERNVDDVDVKGGRIAVAITPSDAFSINLAALGSNRKADGFTQIDVDQATLVPIYGRDVQSRARNAELFDTRVRLYYATLAYDFGDIDLTSTTSYNTMSSTSTQDLTEAYGPVFGPVFEIPNLGFAAGYDINQNKLTQELRLSRNLGSGLDWTIGAFYTRERSNTLVTLPAFDASSGAPADLPALLNSRIIGRYREAAAFGQATYHLTDRAQITAGIRYAHNWQRATSLASGALVGPDTVERSRTDDGVVTFSVAPSYKLSEDVTVYARVASGYRPGGTNGGDAPILTYGPDRLVNYEAGIKGSLVDRTLSFELSAFYVKWSDIQLQVLSPANLNYTDNAGKASSRGVEGNLVFTPTRGFTLTGSATYADSHLDEDIPSGQFGAKGDVLPFSPKWKLAASADYKTRLSGDIGGFIGASLFYTDDVKAGFRKVAGVSRVSLPSFLTVDGRIGISHGEWTFSLIGKNLFDKRGYTGVTEMTLDPTGTLGLTAIQPRTISLSLRYGY